MVWVCALSGCVVDPDVAGKPPPCAPGYFPDPTGRRCVQAVPGVDAEGFDAGMGPPDAPPGDVIRAADGTELAAAIAMSREQPGAQIIELTPGVTYALGSEIVLDHDVTIRGAGPPCSAILDGSAVHRVIRAVSGTAHLSSVQIQRGLAVDEAGGGIQVRTDATLTLVDSCVTSNVSSGSTPGGGGVAVIGFGSLELVGSRVYDNTSEFRGGGILIDTATRVEVRGSEVVRNVVSGEAGDRRGAGIAIVDSSEVSIDQSLVAQNSEMEFGLWGGGISVTGTSGVTITNTTISSNRCQFGVGLFVEGGDVSLNHVTIASNEGTDASARGVWLPGGSVSFENSLFADNRAVDGTLRNCHDNDAATSLGGNAGEMEGSPDYDCGIDEPAATGDILDDPAIAPLAENGGFTRTHAIEASSPAEGLATKCLDVDQRGEMRSSPCDSGAFELP